MKGRKLNSQTTPLATLHEGLSAAAYAVCDIYDLAGGHARPTHISKGLAQKARRRLKALEALVRRILLTLALYIEPDIHPSTEFYEGRPKAKKPRAPSVRKPMLRLFTEPPEPSSANFKALQEQLKYFPPDTRKPNAPAIFTRIKALQNLLAEPDKAARRLAYKLRRQRPARAVALPPDTGRIDTNSFNMLMRQLYSRLHSDIFTLAFQRPTPVGPHPGWGPRITQL